MKFATTLVGAGALWAGTDAFVPMISVGGSPGGAQVIATSSRDVSSSTGSSGMVMLLGGSGKRRSPRSLSSKIANVFRGNKSKGNFNGSNGGCSGGKGGGNKFPPLSSSASSSDDGEKKSGNVLAILWAAYISLLDTQPILTKSLTSMTGFALGDILAQKFVEKKDEFDVVRLMKLASFGALVHGSTGHFFYNFLDSKIPGTAALTVAKKVFIDQILWNPVFGCMFFGYMGAVDGMGLSAIGEKIQNNLWTSVRGSWTVWPLAHAVNFRFVPTSQRLLYINTIQVFYNCFLSIISQRE